MTIKDHRLKCGLTQEFIARALDITLNTYQKIEYGEITPNVLTGLKLAILLKVEPNILWLNNS
jgi:DNA-binding XRE family transcriptional regulator